MKKILYTVIIVLSSLNSFSQSLSENDKSVNIQKTENGIKTYRLFPTDNMWTFIKLNTRNGQMWQIQYSMEDNRFESPLSLIQLVKKNEEIDNRFTLYKTQNTWTFILLDQIDGRAWQVQWSIDYEKRGILPIE